MLYPFSLFFGAFKPENQEQTKRIYSVQYIEHSCSKGRVFCLWNRGVFVSLRGGGNGKNPCEIKKKSIPFAKGDLNMEFLKRAKKEMLGLQLDVMTELQSNRSAYRPAAGAGLAMGTVMNLATMMLASTVTISGFGAEVKTVVVNIYNAVFPVVTVIAALLLVIAFIVRMTGNQQKASQATSWIVRIIICYVCINCIGLLFKVIDGATTKYRW